MCVCVCVCVCVSCVAGAPREQGHYGFMLTDLYLLPLLSGQVVDLPSGKLALAPKYPAP